MAKRDGDWDPAAEQLYDELMSRTWALHLVLGSASTDVTRDDVCDHLATVARRCVCLQRVGDDVDPGLDGLLWPSGACPDDRHPWWSTPLGQLMSTRRRCQPGAHRDVGVGVDLPVG